MDFIVGFYRYRILSLDFMLRFYVEILPVPDFTYGEILHLPQSIDNICLSTLEVSEGISQDTPSRKIHTRFPNDFPIKLPPVPP